MTQPEIPVTECARSPKSIVDVFLQLCSNRKDVLKFSLKLNGHAQYTLTIKLTPAIIDRLMSTSTSLPCESVQTIFRRGRMARAKILAWGQD